MLPAAFQFRFMALAVDAIDRHSPGYEMRRKLQLKKTKGNAVLAIYVALYLPFITNKTERFSFKSGCVIWTGPALANLGS